MSTQVNTTELDFDQIKKNLKDYFKREGGQFRDYDYEGSGLNNLLDILAYNTHYNAVNAHMAMNESFLDSAQVRGNVVSRAKLLGYTPKSITAPTALINVTFSRREGGTEQSLTLPRGTKFTSIIDEVSYSFETTATVKSTVEDGYFKFTDLEIAEGSTRSEVYTIDNSYDQRFIINAKNVDTSTLLVEVFPNLNSDQSKETYEKFSEFPTVDGSSRIYFLDENSDGNFEIRFGNDLFGKRPQASGRVQISYLVTKGPVTNGAVAFRYKTGQANIDAQVNTENIRITTSSRSAGGALAEDINSIKYNAPLSFIAQERAVTSDDYKSLIMKNFSGIDTVAAWGGETETVPVFGKVYISVKPTAAEFLTAGQKRDILQYLQGKKVVGMTPEIVDAEYTYIYYQLFFKYDPSATTISKGGLEAIVRQTLQNYNSARLNNFDGVYRHSNFLSSIDSSNNAILNTTARVFAYKKLDITTSTADVHVAEFDFQLDGDVNQTQSMITTTPFLVNGRSTRLFDRPIAGDDSKREIYSVRSLISGDTSATETANIGFVTPGTGKIEINNLVHDNNETIEIQVRPSSDDIISQKRKILQIDVNKSTIVGDIDNISVAGSSGLSDYNTFNRD